uniref:Sorcin n=1 Tax=Papio anubis TaxID=9555 RepID=A0A2I3LF62_PAPAN
MAKIGRSAQAVEPRPRAPAGTEDSCGVRPPRPCGALWGGPLAAGRGGAGGWEAWCTEPGRRRRSLHHGVPRASWRRRRVLPRRVRRGSRRTCVSRTNSGSAVWLLCCCSWTAFNLETCRLMVSMLDRDMSGKMGFNEFKELWAVLNGWRQHFISFDTDRSGTVDPQELQKALTTMGFRLSPQAVNSIAKRYSTNGKITFDDYIACCVKLRALTDSFRRRDTAQQGVVNFPYDDFIQCVMSV